MSRGRIGAVVVIVLLVGALAAPGATGASGMRSGRGPLSGGSGRQRTTHQLPPPADDLNQFGYGAAVSGDTAVVVAVHTAVAEGGGYTGDQGQAFVYSDTGGTWSPTPVATLPAPAAQGQFGTSVAVSGTTIAVSDPNTVPEAVYLYSEGTGGWPTTPTVTLTDPAWFPGYPGNDNFGESVALSGTTLLVGSDSVGGNGDGVVRVYTEADGVWPTSPTTTLVDPGGSATNATNDGFGVGVALSGSTALIGAYGSNGDGRHPVVYEYTEDPVDGWPAAPTETLAAPDGNECFGDDGLAVSGATALIGGGCFHPAKDVVYVYSETDPAAGGAWSTRPVAVFHDPAAGLGDYFGTVEAVSGRIAVIGSPGFRHVRGRAYVYTESRGGIWRTTPTHVFEDPTATPWDWFGWAVGLSGHTAFISARGADDEDDGSSGLVEVAHI